MLKSAIKLAGTISKVTKTKSAPDILKAGAATIGLAEKLSKKKKKTEETRAKRVRR